MKFKEFKNSEQADYDVANIKEGTTDNDNIISTIKSLRGLRSLTPATNDEIAEAEKQLALLFCEDFKQYLSEFGAIYSEEVELKGIAKTKGYNVVEFTNMVREVSPTIPKDFYVVSETEYNHIVICQNEKGLIYEWRNNDNAVYVSPSLAQYIKTKKKNLK